MWFVQADGTVWIPAADAAADLTADAERVGAFAELVSEQDHVLRYRIRPVTLWQAAASGWTARQVLQLLRARAKPPLPLSVQELVVREMGKWGRLRLQRVDECVQLVGDSEALAASERILLENGFDLRGQRMPLAWRGPVKQLLARRGWPVMDEAGMDDGTAVLIGWRDGDPLRPYQQDALHSFLQRGGGGGIVVLPCGAGKTLVGLGAMVAVGQSTLIVAPNEAAGQQWLSAITRFLQLPPDAAKLYRGRDLAPITITTYSRIAARDRRGHHVHLSRFTASRWGLVIYDEVHMLPAPLFRLAAELQGVRRLGLTATLVREDGAEADVFTLIGPKCYGLPWRSLEAAGYLAKLKCIELRVPLPPDLRLSYERASPRERHKLAAHNPNKLAVARRLVQRHAGQSVLILGHYLEPLRSLSAATGWPLVSGDTPQSERRQLYEAFRDGAVRTLILSRVGNVAVDLPSASVGIQLSGLFGSRQEEAQRVGRLLRPQGDTMATFYTLVSADTVEERQARRRQMFLTEQGYEYEVQGAESVTDITAPEEVMA